MSKRVRWVNVTGFSLAVAFALAALASRSANGAEQGPHGKRAVLLYGDRLNAEGFLAPLRASGLVCQALPQRTALEKQNPRADLIVCLACCDPRRWDHKFFEWAGESRVIAMGDSGAALLEKKMLLIGHPHGWHGTRRPKVVLFPQEVLRGPYRKLLLSPNDLLKGRAGATRIEIHSGVGKLEHIGICDGGKFPEGTVGIGRELKSTHHWMIAKQGNYLLWGANSRAENLTEAGNALFVNVCGFLSNAKPEPLVFPEKRVVGSGRHKGTLVSGWRNKYYLIPTAPGKLVIRLEWSARNTMMLLVSGAIRKREDGVSPLVFSHEITATHLGKEIEIQIGSFALPKDKKCDYRLHIDLPAMF